MKIKFFSNDKMALEFSDTMSSSRKGNDHYFTILIGENGAGKSTVLGELARQTKNNKDFFNSIVFENGETPARTISYSSTIYDKFPHIEANRYLKNDIVSENFSRNYFYFGPKASRHFSSRTILNQMLDAISLASMDKNSSSDLEYIFKLAGYLPEILLEYTSFKKDYSKYDFSSPKRFIESYRESPSRINWVEPFLNGLEDPEVFFIFSKMIQGFSISSDFQFVLNLKSAKGYNNYLHRLKALNIGEKFGFFRLRRCSLFKSDKNLTFNKIDIKDLSSGEATMIMKNLSISSVAQDNSLILIDEPENSLHPSWQINLIDNLKKTLRNVRGCHIVIATHSPFIISSLPSNVSSVVHLTRKNNIISGKFYEGETFGSSVEKVLLDIFGVSTVRNFYFEQKLRELLSLISSEPKDQTEIKKIIAYFNEFQISPEDPLFNLIKRAESFVK